MSKLKIYNPVDLSEIYVYEQNAALDYFWVSGFSFWLFNTYLYYMIKFIIKNSDSEFQPVKGVLNQIYNLLGICNVASCCFPWLSKGWSLTKHSAERLSFSRRNTDPKYQVNVKHFHNFLCLLNELLSTIDFNVNTICELSFEELPCTNKF